MDHEAMKKLETNLGYKVLKASGVAAIVSNGGLPIAKSSRRNPQAGYSISQVPGKLTWVMAQFINIGSGAEPDCDYTSKSKVLEYFLIRSGFEVSRPFPDQTILAVRQKSSQGT